MVACLPDADRLLDSREDTPAVEKEFHNSLSHRCWLDVINTIKRTAKYYTDEGRNDSPDRRDIRFLTPAR
jgi:hypothetical protein